MNANPCQQIILAGYEDDMNEKLFKYNHGFASRFKDVVFEDFDERELLEVWTTMLEEKGWQAADSRIANVVVRRMLKRVGKKGFGNAREVRKTLEEACGRAMSRDNFDPKNLVIQIKDAVGENPAHNEKLNVVLDEIRSKIGWHKIKRTVTDLVELCSENYERELAGEKPLPVFLNRMCLGNPGTGKTTCARLYGQVLKHLGLLSYGDVVSKGASDFGGKFVGEAQQKTVEALTMAAGKVLIIDEAYCLDDKFYGKTVLDTLVEKVQGTDADDIAVLLLGYEEPMLEMLRKQNPGLRRRFPPDQAFMFEDFDDEELDEILRKRCEQEAWKTDLDFRQRALKKLEKQRTTEPYFGNAGAVDVLLKAAVSKATSHKSRAARGGIIHLKAEHVDLGPDVAVDDPFARLDQLYRMEGIKKQLIQLKNKLELADQEGDDLPQLGHFVFQGAPGTGKTTVARIVAEILFQLGLLAKRR